MERIDVKAPYSLGCRRLAGILGVSPWNGFCPLQNPTRLIRAFVFSESPTVEWFRECSGSVQTMGRNDQILIVTAFFYALPFILGGKVGLLARR